MTKKLPFEDKILSLEELTSKITTLRKEHKKIVTYNGSFDILHTGHIRSIYEAKQQGDVLIIALNSDASVKLYKSSKRPIVKEHDRAIMLASLAAVDYVVLFDEINSKSVLERIKPDIHCNGSDWGRDCVERETVEKNGGTIHILEWEQGFSTSELIKNVLHAYTTPLTKAVFIDRDGTINDNKDGYIHTISEFSFLPGVIEALKLLQKSDFKIIVVTNQSGVGRGMYTEQDLQVVHSWMKEYLSKEGVVIDAIYYCPHKPDEMCDCRKPRVGMLMNAVKDFDISLNDSWVIGDDEKDIIMAREGNVSSIKLGERMPELYKLEPNFYEKNLLDAVKKILSQ